MKRWTLRIMLLLILVSGGAVTTVAVAWWRTGSQISRYATFDQGLEARAELNREFGEATWIRPHWGQSEGIGFRLVELGGETRDTSPQLHYVVRIFCGWPMHAMTGVARLDRAGETLSFGLRIEDDDSVYPERFLPLRPSWPGFLIDTLFYAVVWGAIWFVISFGFASARRVLRRTRGRCPKCNYDLRGELDKGCSECGWNRKEEGTDG